MSRKIIISYRFLALSNWILAETTGLLSGPLMPRIDLMTYSFNMFCSLGFLTCSFSRL